MPVVQGIDEPSHRLMALELRRRGVHGRGLLQETRVEARAPDVEVGPQATRNAVARHQGGAHLAA